MSSLYYNRMGNSADKKEKVRLEEEKKEEER